MPYGQNAKYGVIFQNSWDSVGSVNSVHFLPILNESVGKNIPPIMSETMRGLFEEGDVYEGANTNDGDIEIEAMCVPVGLLLSCVLEQTAMITSGSMYTRTFRPRTTDWDSKSAGRPFTIYKDTGVGSAMLFSNMNGVGFEMAIANGELVKMKMSVAGGAFSQTAPISANSTPYPSGRIFTWDVISASFGGTAIADIAAMTIKLNEAVEPIHTLNNSKLPSGTKHTGFRTLDVDGTLKFNDQTEYQAFLAQSERSLVVNMQGATLVQSGYYESVAISVPAFRYTEFKPALAGPNEITVGFTAKGLWTSTTSYSIQITHRSGKATY